MKTISIAVPCYNEEESLPIFMQETYRVAEEMHAKHGVAFEIVLVDDGSKDGTLEQFRSSERFERSWFRVRWYSFSRNFGKEASIFAGLSHATGDFVATMDADMQDPPSLLPQMYERLIVGDVDCVATRRATREGEPPIRSFFARMFYRLINKLSQTEIVDGARDFRLMTRQMVDAIISMPEYNRFSKGIFSWVGFKTEWIPYVNVNRVAGETSWNFFSLFLYSIDGIVAFSTAPLSVASVCGCLLCLFSLLGIIFIVVRTALVGDPVDGWPSLVCIITFLGGIQLLCLGIMGQYLSKTYLETKRRPIYIIKESRDAACSSLDSSSEERS